MKDLLNVTPSPEQVRSFQSQGFFPLGSMSDDGELIWLRNVYDNIVKKKTGYTPQELGQGHPKNYQESLLTILSPENVIPELMNTDFYHNVRSTFAQFLDVEDSRLRTGWRIFCKPAYSGATPWHQDAAYRPPPHRSISIWMSLDLATLESSCLHYISGSHLKGVLAHNYHDDHLVVNAIDSSRAVACPVQAGEAIIHHCCTLHYAGPNTTGQPRRALTIVCQTTDVP